MMISACPTYCFFSSPLIRPLLVTWFKFCHRLLERLKIRTIGVGDDHKPQLLYARSGLGLRSVHEVVSPIRNSVKYGELVVRPE